MSLRVAQWATGNIGLRSLRAVLEHPALELVALKVYSASKEGKDAGELCGSPATGVLATRSLDDVIAARPDVALYMPADLDAADVCRLLAAGISVVTTRTEFHHPPSMDPALRSAIENACAAGRSSIHSTGSSPGFISEAVPVVLTSLARRLDRLVIREFADLSRRDSPDLLFGRMGFAAAPGAFDHARFDHGAAAFGPTLRQLGHALGLGVDDVRSHGRIGLASRDVRIAAGPVPAGTVGAQEMRVDAYRNGEPLLRFAATWYCTRDLAEDDWDLRDTGWRITVDGDTPLDVDLRIAVPLDRMAETSPGLTAHRAVNALPMVAAAAPGIRTTDELPQVIADLSPP